MPTTQQNSRPSAIDLRVPVLVAPSLLGLPPRPLVETVETETDLLLFVRQGVQARVVGAPLLPPGAHGVQPLRQAVHQPSFQAHVLFASSRFTRAKSCSRTAVLRSSAAVLLSTSS